MRRPVEFTLFLEGPAPINSQREAMLTKASNRAPASAACLLTCGAQAGRPVPVDRILRELIGIKNTGRRGCSS